MFGLLRQRNFALLWFGGLISTMGDWALLVGLPIYTYTLTHSIAATSGTFLADQIPQILLGSFAGVFVDRWDRKWALIVTNILLALGLLPLLFIHAAAQLWIVYLVAAIESVFSQFLTAESALLPRLVGEDQLVTANSLNAFSSNAARLIGPTLGGVVAVAVGLAGIALLDALTFLIAAVLTLLIVVPALPQPVSASSDNTANTRPSRFQFWRDWLDGLRMIRRDRALVGFYLVMAIAAFADGIFIVLFAPFVKTLLHGNAADIGYLTSAQAVGGLIGGLIVPRITRWKWVSAALLITTTGLFLGVNHLFVFNYTAFSPSRTLALISFLVGGIATIGFFVQLTTLLQTHAPDAYRGRMFGVYSLVWAFFLLLGTSLTGVVGDRITILPLLDIEAGLFFPAAIIAWLMLRPHAAVAPVERTDQPIAQVKEEQPMM